MFFYLFSFYFRFGYDFLFVFFGSDKRKEGTMGVSSTGVHKTHLGVDSSQTPGNVIH